MPYTTNKNMPRIRREAAELVRRGWSARKVGRYLGYHHTAIMEWVRRSQVIGYHPIPTRSSRPLHHPKQLSDDVVEKIVKKRREHHRYAEALHKELENDGVRVSLSSVKRTLKRKGLLRKRSPYKRFHPHVDRPYPLSPGDLVEIDTIHRMTGEKTRLYVFTLIDIYSRQTYAWATERMNSKISVGFVLQAKKALPFDFKMIQTDHGPEFGKHFVLRIQNGHRYTRIGKPNDNSHIERFNRTLQEECLDKVPNDARAINCALKKYLRYYNYERVHGGINYRIPVEVV